MRGQIGGQIRTAHTHTPCTQIQQARECNHTLYTVNQAQTQKSQDGRQSHIVYSEPNRHTKVTRWPTVTHCEHIYVQPNKQSQFVVTLCEHRAIC